jgi:hypothetical protein
MKKCSYCGLENPDEAAQCATCQTDLNPAEPPPPPKLVTALDEQRFWERMTFRQFAALWVRLQAIWLLFNGLLEMTYLPSYINYSYLGGIYINPGARFGFFLMILRILLHVAAAVALIQFAEKIVSWFIKDWIRNQPDDAMPKRTETGA